MNKSIKIIEVAGAALIWSLLLELVCRSINTTVPLSEDRNHRNSNKYHIAIINQCDKSVVMI